MSTSSTRVWRLLDTGLRSAAQNISLNRALLESHQRGDSPPTLRFLQFTPAALVGFHQSVAQELREEYCARNRIDIQRRITGGGAIYCDATQIGWELYLHKVVLGTADMQAVAARICEAAASGIRRLGVDASFRPRNDIEVDGRKLSGTGGAFDGDSLLYQGTLLIDFDVENMLRVLRIPAEKLSDKAVASARDRVVNLRELLGAAPPLDEVHAALSTAFSEAFGVTFEPGGLNPAEQDAYSEALTEVDTREWVYQRNEPVSDLPLRTGLHRCGGGLLRACVSFDTVGNRIRQVWITGDIFVNPRRMIPDLEAALRDTPVADIRARIDRFFDTYPTEMLLLGREDFAAAVRNAVHAEEGGGTNAVSAGS